MRIKHHIIVKWNESVKDKMALLPEIESLFNQALMIEGIEKVELIPNVIDRSNRYDLIIAIDMERSSLSLYDDCEAHHLWKEKYGSMIEKKAIFDSEIQ